ncbi:MAG: maleylpyruvate isomerase N-terminal domain-containing protein [Bacteroidota bacterium]
MKTIPFDALAKLPALEQKFISLIKGLTVEEWQAQTIAKLWKVKDVVTHLLDGNIRTLSMLRDKHFGEGTTASSYEELVTFLNGLNADWVKAMKRVSPQMLILLHEVTGPLYYQFYASQDPFAKAAFSVVWAGEAESKNWMHHAREYTEKFLHQQQIRDAVNKPGIMNKEFFYPFADICMMALPHTFRAIEADEGSVLKMQITGEMGGKWYLRRIEQTWQLSKEARATTDAEVIMGANEFWQIVSKSKRYTDFPDKIITKGDSTLAQHALSMVSFMA